MKRLSLFMSDDKLLFIPKNTEQLKEALAEANSNRKTRIYQAELEVFKNICAPLQIRSPEEETRLTAV